MDPERRRRIEDLCDAALDRDAAERATFVAAACGDDEALRGEVEALLAHAQAAEGFLATPIGGVAALILADEHGSLVGRQIGSHKILSLLGAGGMGDVYRARDNRLDRDVAIKVVPNRFLSLPGRLARFELEARVLASLNHPHIGAIYGLEDADGVRGLVLELVEGATLAERVAAGPLSIQEALDVARQIADALEAAHDKGIIHRDLKPANVKITSEGTVKVLDFGLAKVFATEESVDDVSQTPAIATVHTQEGVVEGTTAYMSPEQARGKTVDKRTDIWAFGCVLYEMLTARPAFAGETSSDTIVAILEREPDWSVLPAQTRPSIRRLLERCLQKDPKRRLRDIGDARLEIEEALASFVASATPVASEHGSSARLKPAPRWVRRAWWAAAVAGLVVIAAASTWQLRRTEYFWRSPLESATITRLTDFGGAEHHAAISRDGKFVTFLSDHDGAWNAWVSQVGSGDIYNLTKGSVPELRNPATRTLGFNPDGTLVTLWRRVPDSAGGGLVNAGWAVPTLGGPLRPYLKDISDISELDWSPDGSLIVYHPPTDGDPLFVTDPDEKVGRRKIYEAQKGFHNHFPVWSHDGAFIYFVQGLPLEKSDIWRIRPTGGQPERLTFHDARVTFPTLLNNRTLMYLAADDEGYGPWIHAMDVERRIPHRIFAGVEPHTSLAASADGRRLVATVSRSTAHLWRVPIADGVMDESDATRLSLPTASGLSPRMKPGYVIYRGQKAGRDGLWKVAEGGTATELWNGVNGRVIAGAAIAPGGQRVAFTVQARGVTQLYLMNTDGTDTRRVAQELDVRGAPAWSPDGRWLAVAANRDGEPRLFKMPVAGGTPVPLVQEYSIDPTWSPSGQFLVYSGADVGTTFSVKGVSADGAPHSLPPLILTRGARRLAFIGDDTLVIMKGDVSHKEFWAFDLKTGRERQLTRFRRGFVIGDFDISPDGREIIFDRTREESDIVLFDLPDR
jgi:Tol biopolymer transport system component/tRNA A-37 threonylcarbamoyl transferase component Bud32